MDPITQAFAAGFLFGAAAAFFVAARMIRNDERYERKPEDNHHG